MIEIISISKPISLKDLEAAKMYKNGLFLTGINQLKEPKKIVVSLKEFHPLEEGVEYFFLQGTDDSTNRVAEGTVGSIADNTGHFGRLVLHI